MSDGLRSMALCFFLPIDCYSFFRRPLAAEGDLDDEPLAKVLKIVESSSSNFETLAEAIRDELVQRRSDEERRHAELMESLAKSSFRRRVSWVASAVASGVVSYVITFSWLC